jgi:hypothetical protein
MRGTGEGGTLPLPENTLKSELVKMLENVTISELLDQIIKTNCPYAHYSSQHSEDFLLEN